MCGCVSQLPEGLLFHKTMKRVQTTITIHKVNKIGRDFLWHVVVWAVGVRGYRVSDTAYARRISLHLTIPD